MNSNKLSKIIQHYHQQTLHRCDSNSKPERREEEQKRIDETIVKARRSIR